MERTTAWLLSLQEASLYKAAKTLYMKISCPFTGRRYAGDKLNTANKYNAWLFDYINRKYWSFHQTNLECEIADEIAYLNEENMWHYDFETKEGFDRLLQIEEKMKHGL